MNAGGSDERVIMQSQGGTEEDCRSGAIVGGWSPDDERIVYYSANVAKQEAQVCMVRSDGSDIQAVVSEPPGFYVEPSWSPDGRRIAYRGIVEGNADIWWVDVQTGEQFNVTKSPSIDLEPSWSPDGQWLTFGSNRDDPSNFDIYFVRTDGTDVRRFTHNANKDSESIWRR
jgi:TolB protein